MRDAFFASPLFPRVLSADVVKETISRGVGNGTFAYVGKVADGSYSPLAFNRPLMTGEIEFSEDMFLVTRETADAYFKSKESPPSVSAEKPPVLEEGQHPKSPISPVDKEPGAGGSGGKAEQLTFSKLGWSGEVHPQKWMNFYTKA